MKKVIITVAIVGTGPTREQNPNLPITPEEIADSAVASYHAGASIAHIHVRDPKTGLPSNKLDLFAEVVERIRDRCDMILNLSTGNGGGLFISSEGEIIDEYSDIQSPQQRVAHVLKLKPEICSLDIGSMNFGPGLFVNPEGVVDSMAAMIKESGTKPELELFDIGHIQIAERLIKMGLVEGIPHFQLCMGTSGGMAASPRNTVYFSESLPDGCTWSAFGVGRNQFDMVAMAVLLNGHTRVGFEDNLYLEKGIKAESNAELVERAVVIIETLNREVASAVEAREILGLR
jgi:uncharacterized protein (DUF849 family)